MNNKAYNDFMIGGSITKVALEYGKDFARNIEQLFRLETNNFKSKQWLQCFSPGMEQVPGKTVFPFGWSSLREYAVSKGINPDSFKLVKMQENGTGIIKTFIGFPDIDSSIGFVAWFIANKRKGRLGYWYRLDEEDASSYESTLSKISTSFVR